MPTAVMSPLRANSAWVRRSLCACRSNSKTVIKSTDQRMTRQPHILVVDDEHSIRLMLESGLSLNGFRVSFARTGAEALAAAPTQEFDAVISDIYMPDGDGLTLVQDLRALFPALPIILMTAQGSVELASGRSKRVPRISLPNHSKSAPWRHCCAVTFLRHRRLRTRVPIFLPS